MENSTRNILIGVVLVGLIFSALCCVGGVAYVFMTGAVVDEVQKDLKKSESAKKDAPKDKAVSQLELLGVDYGVDKFWKEARQDGWKVPAVPRLSAPGDQEAEGKYQRHLTISPGNNPAKIFTKHPEMSALLSGALLVDGRSAETARLIGHDSNAIEMTASLAFFGSCGKLTRRMHHGLFQTFPGPSEWQYTYHYSTEHGCFLRVDVGIFEIGATDYFFPTKITLISDEFPVLTTRIKSIDHTRVREISKRYGPKTFEKVYKARRAGMKAQQFFSTQLIGNEQAIREVVPKAKLVDFKFITSSEHGLEMPGLDYHLDLNGKQFTYRVYWLPLQLFSNKKADAKKFFLVGEDIFPGRSL